MAGFVEQCSPPRAPRPRAANEDGHEHKVLVPRRSVQDTTPNVCHAPFPDFTDHVQYSMFSSVFCYILSQHFYSICHRLTNAFALAQAVPEKGCAHETISTTYAQRSQASERFRQCQTTQSLLNSSSPPATEVLTCGQESFTWYLELVGPRQTGRRAGARNYQAPILVIGLRLSCSP